MKYDAWFSMVIYTVGTLSFYILGAAILLLDNGLTGILMPVRATLESFATNSIGLIESGTVAFKLDGKEIVAGPGETVVVPAGSTHKFWNAGETAAVFVTEVRPALQFERLLETMFALANDGKTNRKGMPNPLRLAVIANAHFDDVRLPFPPAWMQKAGLVLGAPLGRALGFKPEYDGSESRSEPALAL